jgi:hypothetical protein
MFRVISYLLWFGLLIFIGLLGYDAHWSNGALACFNAGGSSYDFQQGCTKRIKIDYRDEK